MYFNRPKKGSHFAEVFAFVSPKPATSQSDGSATPVCEPVASCDWCGGSSLQPSSYFSRIGSNDSLVSVAAVLVDRVKVSNIQHNYNFFALRRSWASARYLLSRLTRH